MFCVNCGNELPGDALFCPKCGAKAVSTENRNFKAEDKSSGESECFEKNDSTTEPVVMSKGEKDDNTETDDTLVSEYINNEIESVNIPPIRSEYASDNSLSNNPKKTLWAQFQNLSIVQKVVIICLLVLILILIIAFVVKWKSNRNGTDYGTNSFESVDSDSVNATETIAENNPVRVSEITDDLILSETSYFPDSNNIDMDMEYTYYASGAVKKEVMYIPIASSTITTDYMEPVPNEFTWVTSRGTDGLYYYKVMYDDNFQIIEFDACDEYMNNTGDTDSYEYDENGNVTQRTQGYSDGTFLTKTCEYDEYNVLIKENWYSNEYTDGKGKEVTYKYDYDDNGLPKVRYEYDDGILVYTTDIYRDSQGLIIKEEQTDSDGKTTVTEYERCLKDEYDAQKEITDTSSQDDYAVNDSSSFMDENLEYEDASSMATEFIIPDSSSKLITKADLKGLTKEECRIARNEIYARHGRIFADQELQDYFESKSWYAGTIEPDDFTEDILNDIEKENTTIIENYEKEQGYR